MPYKYNIIDTEQGIGWLYLCIIKIYLGNLRSPVAWRSLSCLVYDI